VRPHGQEHLRILLRSSAVQKRVREMGLQISKDFKGQRVHLIGVLKGAAIFLSDLIRHIRVDVSLDFMAVSSYGKGSHTSGQVRLVKDLDTSIEGLNVIVVEDILDTGLTLGYLLRVLQQRKPKSLRIAALLDKPERRIKKDVKADYVGFRFPTNLSSDMAWTTPSATATLRMSACSHSRRIDEAARRRLSIYSA